MMRSVMFHVTTVLLLLLFIRGRGTEAEPAPHPHPYSPYFGVFPYPGPYVNYIDPYHQVPPAYAPPYGPSHPADPFAPSLPADPFVDAAPYPADQPDEPATPTLTLLAEAPRRPSAEFRVVPLTVVSQESVRVVGDAHVLQASRRRPALTVKTAGDELVQVTPAARVVLDPPLPVHSLHSRLPFPARLHLEVGGVKIPLEVGALIAPVHRGSYVSAQSPAAVSVLYALPTKPVELAYTANRDAVELPDQQAVVVESQDHAGLPHNVTVLEFPDQEAEPVLQVDEDDDELVNRNPPQVLAPAGIVQSTQPQSSVQVFHNSKESPVLTALREEAQKRV